METKSLSERLVSFEVSTETVLSRNLLCFLTGILSWWPSPADSQTNSSIGVKINGPCFARLTRTKNAFSFALMRSHSFVPHKRNPSGSCCCGSAGLFQTRARVCFSGSSGGICEKSKLYSDGKKKSLNTGIITVQNYASHVPPKVSHITFAHEVGHNFGSPVGSLIHSFISLFLIDDVEEFNELLTR